MVGSGRRKILDHNVPLSERCLYRLIRDDANYYQQLRGPDSPGGDAPSQQPEVNRPTATTT